MSEPIPHQAIRPRNGVGMVFRLEAIVESDGLQSKHHPGPLTMHLDHRCVYVTSASDGSMNC